MGYLKFEEKTDMATPNPVREKLQAKVTQATELVFVHPMWWMAPPAIMKNFLDNIINAHFAFVYKDGKPIGLLKGKKGHVFITSDGPMWVYYLVALPFRVIWNVFILRFCGVSPVTFKVFDQKFKKTPAEQDLFLEKVKKVGAR
jgi:NAD(P)H dehydrogenase (quinone)